METTASQRGQFGRGFARGLRPAGVTLALVALTLAALALTRALAHASGFFALEAALQIVTVSGLAAVALGYALACVWVLRGAGRWSAAGAGTRAVGALVGLVMSALLMALPVVVAVLAPQHPASS